MVNLDHKVLDDLDSKLYLMTSKDLAGSMSMSVSGLDFPGMPGALNNRRGAPAQTLKAHDLGKMSMPADIKKDTS